ncbi:sigma 54-interacting transcriptional regulator [candidate division KSB1 bacterium]|nr:sigma 54-interacting transcriptional regulator [candidate division KSB1 bacterium]
MCSFLTSSTNRNLKQLVEQDNFREDLFFRLHVYKIRVAPLRERPEDIPLIADFFIDDYALQSKKNSSSMAVQKKC